MSYFRVVAIRREGTLFVNSIHKSSVNFLQEFVLLLSENLNFVVRSDIYNMQFKRCYME